MAASLEFNDELKKEIEETIIQPLSTMSKISCGVMIINAAIFVTGFVLLRIVYNLSWMLTIIMGLAGGVAFMILLTHVWLKAEDFVIRKLSKKLMDTHPGETVISRSALRALFIMKDKHQGNVRGYLRRIIRVIQA